MYLGLWAGLYIAGEDSLLPVSGISERDGILPDQPGLGFV
jgi:hypothetical protein